MKIITFNIRCADDKEGHSVAERAPRLKKILSEQDAELIGLQECTPLWLEFIKEYFAEKYEIFSFPRSSDSDESVPILWKKDSFTEIKRGVFWLSDTPEVESRGWDELFNCYRICTYVLLSHKQSGKQLLFMNTHFGFGDKGQTDSARLISEYSKKIADVPTLVTGDFNMEPESAGYREMTKYFSDANAMTTNDTGVTFHGYYFPGQNPQHIDYCFINGKVEPVFAKIIKDTVDGKFPSDHYGILFKVQI